MDRKHFDDIDSAVYDSIENQPLLYTAYRVMAIRHYNGVLSESDEIPLIKTPLFPFAIICYLIVKYIWSLSSINKMKNELNSDDHLFVIGTSSKYRTHSLLSIATHLNNENKNITLLLSPESESKMKNWEKEGFKMITHRQLHKRISPISVLIACFQIGVAVCRFRQKISYDLSAYDMIITYNYVLTEYIKEKSLAKVMKNDPYVHTFSPMPYLVKNTSHDKVFVYQHGIQWKSGNTLMSAPFYIPLTYFVWSPVWAESFEDAAHPDSEIIPVGSPWHDYLAQQKRNQNPTFDVLLISQSHGKYGNEIYEQFVSEVINACEQQNLSLKIKLHPKEAVSWYTKRGWNSYIESFDDIDDALQQTRIAVTSSSSAFVESSVFGTPIVVADILDRDLQSLAPVQNVLFPENIDDIPASMTDALEGTLPETTRSVVMTDGAIDRIINHIRYKIER